MPQSCGDWGPVYAMLVVWSTGSVVFMDVTDTLASWYQHAGRFKSTLFSFASVIVVVHQEAPGSQWRNAIWYGNSLLKARMTGCCFITFMTFYLSTKFCTAFCFEATNTSPSIEISMTLIIIISYQYITHNKLWSFYLVLVLEACSAFIWSSQLSSEACSIRSLLVTEIDCEGNSLAFS